MSNKSTAPQVTLREDLTDLYTGAQAATEQIPTSALVTVGLIGGYGMARLTGVRPLGGAVLFAAGAAAAHNWWRKSGPITTATLSTSYLLGFGLSHPLAKKIGAWPSVFAVTGVNAAAAWALADRT